MAEGTEYMGRPDTLLSATTFWTNVVQDNDQVADEVLQHLGMSVLSGTLRLTDILLQKLGREEALQLLSEVREEATAELAAPHVDRA